MSSKSISTKALLAELENPEVAIVDFRPSAAFNGWPLHDEPRGGHIPGAVNLTQPWTVILPSSKLNSLLQSKGITPEKTIILYGCQPESCEQIAASLNRHGITRILTLEGGFQAWAADPGLPLARLAKYQQLVFPAWLKKLAENPNRQKIQLFEASWQGQNLYQAGHIPGAYHLDLSRFESPATYNILPDAELLALLLAHGITAEDQVVLYSKDPLAAFRATWLLLYTGVRDVRLLDGGFDAWINAGYPMETGTRQTAPAEDFGGRIPGRPEFNTGIDALRHIPADVPSRLVSVQSWEEYTGITSGYSYIQPKGRIAKAIWGTSGLHPHDMQNYHNPDNTMRSADEIAANWFKRNITPQTQVTFYCGTGWRASEAFWYAHLMDWKNISVYDGGWHEWSQDAANPFETGIPEDDRQDRR